MTIPSQINGKRVEIGEFAFAYNNFIKQVIIPETITNIPASAFRSCRNLEFVYIPAGVKTIGNYAFFNCQNVKYIELAAGLQLDKIGDFCFGQNYALTEIRYTVASITAIGNSVFSNCTSLANVDLSNMTIETVGNLLFQNCTSLKKVKLPKVNAIGLGAFSNCTAINDVTVPFVGAANFIKYYFNISSSTSSSAIPASLKFVTVLDGSTSIANNAFYNCSNIVVITLPSSVQTIGSGAFYGCSFLQEVKLLSDSVVTLSNQNAFNGCHVNMKIKVSAELVEDYKIAQNWSAWSANIVSK